MNAREGRRQGYMHLLDNQQHVGNVSGRVEETILNRVQNFKSFVYGTIRCVEGTSVPTLEVGRCSLA